MSRAPSPMIILGIDPGYDRIGIAVIEKNDGKGGVRSGSAGRSRGAKGATGHGGPSQKDAVIFSECFETSSKDTIYERFQDIGAHLTEIMDEYKPDAVALENLFISKNQKTAMRVSEARGIMIYEAGRRDIPVHEYSPMEIKMSVSGDGTSDKVRMMKMVRLLVDIPEKKMLDDEYDAIAVALACSANLHSPLKIVA